MFCVNCGKEVKEGSKFCTNCGAEIKAPKKTTKKEEKKENVVEVKNEKLSYSQNKAIETTSNPNPVEKAPAVVDNSTDGKATASLVLGIVSFVVPCVGFITSIIGLILGIVSHEKSGKRTAGIILNSIALGLIILGWILLYSFGYIASWTEPYTPSTPPPTYDYNKNNNNNKKYTLQGLGEVIEFDNFEITFGNNYSFTTVDSGDYAGKDVIKLPVTLKNVSDTNDHLNMFYHKYYGPSGNELKKLGSYFSSDSIDYGYLDPNESQTKYFYLLYDGDGKYKIVFNNYKEEKTVEFTIKK